MDRDPKPLPSLDDELRVHRDWVEQQLSTPEHKSLGHENWDGTDAILTQSAVDEAISTLGAQSSLYFSHASQRGLGFGERPRRFPPPPPEVELWLRKREDLKLVLEEEEEEEESSRAKNTNEFTRERLHTSQTESFADQATTAVHSSPWDSEEHEGFLDLFPSAPESLQVGPNARPSLAPVATAATTNKTESGGQGLKRPRGRPPGRQQTRRLTATAANDNTTGRSQQGLKRLRRGRPRVYRPGT